MVDGKEKLKIEIKTRIYNWILKLIRILKTLPTDPCTKIIIEQLLRSGTSVGANYIEAQAASSRRDFINFIHHSLKSANESKFWLAILRDTNEPKKVEINKLLDELKEIANILGASLLTLKGKR